MVRLAKQCSGECQDCALLLFGASEQGLVGLARSARGGIVKAERRVGLHVRLRDHECWRQKGRALRESCQKDGRSRW